MGCMDKFDPLWAKMKELGAPDTQITKCKGIVTRALDNVEDVGDLMDAGAEITSLLINEFAMTSLAPHMDALLNTTGDCVSSLANSQED